MCVLWRNPDAWHAELSNSIACRSEGVAERDIEFLGVMGWGLMLTENSSVAVAVPREGPRGGPLDFREIILFFGNFKKSMILLVCVETKKQTHILKIEMGRSGWHGSIRLVVAL